MSMPYAQLHLLACGGTEDGTRVVVIGTDNPGKPLVKINGVAVEIERANVYRDGGTRTFKLSTGDTLTFPHKIGNPDRIPKLNGKNIT